MARGPRQLSWPGHLPLSALAPARRGWGIGRCQARQMRPEQRLPAREGGQEAGGPAGTSVGHKVPLTGGRPAAANISARPS